MGGEVIGGVLGRFRREKETFDPNRHLEVPVMGSRFFSGLGAVKELKRSPSPPRARQAFAEHHQPDVHLPISRWRQQNPYSPLPLASPLLSLALLFLLTPKLINI